jgi:5-methylcytosine-specific restriction endonuclease McrA
MTHSPTREPVEVEKRRKLTKREKAEVCLRQRGRCALCEEKLSVEIDFDHVIPLALGGKQTLDNFEALCRDCHKDKTRLDRWQIAKAERQAGRKGQSARREKNGPRLQSRGFDTRFRKKMNGEVEVRDE